MRFIILILIILKINETNAQVSFEDSTRVFFPVSHGTKKWKPLIGFDAYRSFYNGTPVKLNGFRFGLEYRGVHRFGFGFYGLKRNLYFSDIYVDHPMATDTSLVQYRLSYAAIFYERVFYKTKKLEFSFPLYLGAGGLDGYVEGSDSEYYKFTATSFSLMNIGLGAKYYFFSWLAFRISSGMRFTFNTEKELRQSFNGPFYSFGLSISIGELYRKMKTRLGK